ncbi:MAG: helix-turn-helix domain-containing protein [Burkholderiales bacterium]|nr:helix-turn-helix domain-containing protein [Burkholderiales bacterium]
MSEPLPAIQGLAASEDAAVAAPSSAGALLKAAREREGLHLAVLAATIKVTPAKLQALEQDRYDDLPNATFTRALAQSVCRSLKIDPRPVLALLPQPDASTLESAGGKLNEPFRERGGRSEGLGLTRVSKPMFWAGGLLLLAALVVGLLPSSLLERLRTPAQESEPVAAPAAAASGADEEAAAIVVDGGAPAPDGAADASALPLPVAAAETASAPALPASPAEPTAAAVAPAAAGLLTVHAAAQTWVEVVDAQERVLLSRVLEPGETVQLDGRMPLRVRIGNAAATTLLLRGQTVDLAPHTRVNVARLELR